MDCEEKCKHKGFLCGDCKNQEYYDFDAQE
jgi:hypothetical protein